MKQTARRILSAVFLIVGLFSFFIFAKSAGNIAQISYSLWSLLATCISAAVVLVLNH